MDGIAWVRLLHMGCGFGTRTMIVAAACVNVRLWHWPVRRLFFAQNSGDDWMGRGLVYTRQCIAESTIWPTLVLSSVHSAQESGDVPDVVCLFGRVLSEHPGVSVIAWESAW